MEEQGKILHKNRWVFLRLKAILLGKKGLLDENFPSHVYFVRISLSAALALQKKDASSFAGYTPIVLSHVLL